MNVYKAHEIRMWIKDVILPVIVIGGTILVTVHNNEELKHKLDNIISNRDRG